MLSFLLFLLFIFSPSSILQSALPDEQINPYNHTWIEDKVWQKVVEHMLPIDHPIKIALDRIFCVKRPTASTEKMIESGFQILPLRNKRKVVAKHPWIKGYLIKTYLDSHCLASTDWKIWLHRVLGAKHIQASLDKYGYNHLMKVPKKWLYLLPKGADPNPVLEGETRNFILVVEDMKPLKNEKNEKEFKKITKERLNALYVILRDNLLHDSIYIHNIPFCKDGKIAFIDLEHYNSNSRRVRFERLTKYFSPEMQEHWQHLITQGGP
jgi:hypothetical protein